MIYCKIVDPGNRKLEMNSQVRPPVEVFEVYLGLFIKKAGHFRFGNSLCLQVSFPGREPAGEEPVGGADGCGASERKGVSPWCAPHPLPTSRSKYRLGRNYSPV